LRLPVASLTRKEEPMLASRACAGTGGGDSEQEQRRRIAANDELYEIVCSLSFAGELLAECECGSAHFRTTLRVLLQHLKLARAATQARLIPRHFSSVDAIIYLTPAYWLVSP
jgi:hypothetical protein